jgi:hypothetical protein
MITQEQESEWSEQAHEAGEMQMLMIRAGMLAGIFDTLAQLRDQLASATQAANRAGEAAAKAERELTRRENGAEWLAYVETVERQKERMLRLKAERDIYHDYLDSCQLKEADEEIAALGKE